MTKDLLILNKAELFLSGHGAVEGEEMAEFFVTIKSANRPDLSKVFSLQAMTDSYYQGWSLDAMLDEPYPGELVDEDEVEAQAEPSLPFVVASEEAVAAGGLINFMEANYLDTRQPTQINRLAEFLIGPIDISHRQAS